MIHKTPLVWRNAGGVVSRVERYNDTTRVPKGFEWNHW